MTKLRSAYWVGTGLLSLLMLFSAGMYVFNHGHVIAEFTKLGYPTYLIYPLAIAKVLGVLAIVTRKSETLKNWAYIAFFFNILLAFFAHIMAGDGMFAGALVGLLFWTLSYVSERRLWGLSTGA